MDLLRGVVCFDVTSHEYKKQWHSDFSNTRNTLRDKDVPCLSRVREARMACAEARV